MIGRRFFDDARGHNLLDRPRDNPTRTAVVAAFLAWVFTIFVAGATDRFYFRSFDLLRGAGLVLPRRRLHPAGDRLLRRPQDRPGAAASATTHPLRGWNGVLLRRTPEGGFREAAPEDTDGEGPPEPPEGAEKPEPAARE